MIKQGVPVDVVSAAGRLNVFHHHVFITIGHSGLYERRDLFVFCLLHNCRAATHIRCCYLLAVSGQTGERALILGTIRGIHLYKFWLDSGTVNVIVVKKAHESVPQPVSNALAS
jgi:hypothetical protein